MDKKPGSRPPVAVRDVRDTRGYADARRRYADGGEREARPGYGSRGSASGRPASGGTATRVASKKKQKSRFAAFFVIIIFAGIVICVSAFALVINSLTQGNGTTTPAPTVKPTAGIPGVSGSNREIKQVCLVKGVDGGARTLTLYGIDDGRMFYMTASTGTEMKDSYGNDLVFAEFKPGDVVDVTYPEGSTSLSSVRQSAQAQTYFNQENIVVSVTDAYNGTITRGNRQYIYGQELVCLYKGEPYDIGNITEVDKVTLRAYKNVVLYVEVTAGHGVINVAYNEYIRDGTIEIGGKLYAKLDSSRQYPMQEGLYQVDVKGSNIETYTRSVNVKTGETVTVNLGEVQIKKGTLYFAPSISDIYLTVNGTQVNPKDYLVLDYGVYEIRATMLGYEVFEKRFELNTPLYTLQIDMKPLPTPTPYPTPAPNVDTVKFKIIIPNASGVDVYIDDKYVGRTPEAGSPLTVDVEAGYRIIKLVKEGFEPYEQPQLANLDYNEQSLTFYLQDANNTIP